MPMPPPKPVRRPRRHQLAILVRAPVGTISIASPPQTIGAERRGKITRVLPSMSGRRTQGDGLGEIVVVQRLGQIDCWLLVECAR
jgi:hypothetical protein